MVLEISHKVKCYGRQCPVSSIGYPNKRLCDPAQRQNTSNDMDYLCIKPCATAWPGSDLMRVSLVSQTDDDSDKFKQTFLFSTT